MIAVWRLFGLFSWIALCAPFQTVLLWLKAPFAKRLPHIFHRVACRILGLDVQLWGERSRDRPTLFICNHTSYFDIIALGGVLPGSFVAKIEVRGWPLFGFMARLQRTVFVERRRAATAKHRDEMIERLEAGDSLVLFPEGTSNDGNRVLPFKSALFGVAEKPIGGRPLTVQPVSISYTRLNGIPMGRRYRPFYAWYGDMDLASHLFEMAGLGRATVVVECHQPVTIEQFKNRKELAAHCERVISEGVSKAISGRLEGRAIRGRGMRRLAAAARRRARASAGGLLDRMGSAVGNVPLRGPSDERRATLAENTPPSSSESGRG
ncbi:MAG: 1-acyl-sn-glycerol-3-phosphate acyltransferase [Alphaproteobacteria bacterium]|nr:1-acyl-sn-glycerol-3-phosphate acyltransferase [Alphaproteobacteria bacterium]